MKMDLWIVTFKIKPKKVIHKMENPQEEFYLKSQNTSQAQVLNS